MADYHPLLVRALGALPENGPDERAAIYDRARDALVEQLRSVHPPLSASDIDRERLALDRAIDRVEAEAASGFLAGPDGSATPPGAGDRADDDMPEAGRPAAPRLGRKAARPARDPGDPVGGQRERPRVAAAGPMIGRRSSGSALLIGLVLLVVVGGIATAAWVLRDRPGGAAATLPTSEAQIAGPPPLPPAEGDAKYADRVSGGRLSSGGPAPARTATPPAPRTEVAVAQRAILMEENTADPRQPKITAGRALWRIENINAGQGQPLETVVRADITVPDSDLSLSIQIRRNLDPTLPASHTVQLTFRPNTTNPDRAIKDIGLLQLKNDETVRGTPVAGLPVPVTENVFLIGLSDLRGDVERNADLLLHRNWIDLPIRMAKNQRAILSFEKGVSGEQAMNDAFRQWGQL